MYTYNILLRKTSFLDFELSRIRASEADSVPKSQCFEPGSESFCLIRNHHDIIIWIRLPKPTQMLGMLCRPKTSMEFFFHFEFSGN